MHRAPIGRTLLIAGLCALVPLGGNVMASFLTEWTGGRSWLVVPVVAVAVAMVTALVRAYGTPAPAAEPPGRPGDVYPYRRYRRPERQGAPLPLVLLVSVLVLGVGGLALTLGVRYAVGYVTGNETGTERLRRDASGSAGGLTLTVESVEHTAHFTRVKLAARNQGVNPVTLPLFKNAYLIAGDGTTLEADPFRSRWPQDVAPGSLQRGTITFPGHLPDRARRAELSFSHVFSFPPGPDAIKVSGIRLRPP